MDYSKPTLLVISGPNGAGKSTHIQTMLPEELAGIWSFDRDNTRLAFEAELITQNFDRLQIVKRATKMMEERLVAEMKKAIADKRHFALETPLSHADYWKYIDLFEDNSYQIELIYLCLDRVSDCVARVGQRVLEGGHYVAPATIKGVYQMNLQHIDEYHKTFKAIELYDGTKIPLLLVKLEDDQIIYMNNKALKKAWIKKGLPQLTKKLTAFIAVNNIR